MSQGEFTTQCCPHNLLVRLKFGLGRSQLSEDKCGENLEAYSRFSPMSMPMWHESADVATEVVEVMDLLDAPTFTDGGPLRPQQRMTSRLHQCHFLGSLFFMCSQLV